MGSLLLLLAAALVSVGSSPFWGIPGPMLVYQLPIDAMVDVTNDFGVAVLQDYAYTRSNFAFSPYGVASVLVVLYEGSRGEAARQIHNALRLPWNRDITRIGFRDIHRHLRSYFSHEGYLSGLTLNKNHTSLLPEYRRVLRFYGYDVGLASGDIFPPTTTTRTTPDSTEDVGSTCATTETITTTKPRGTVTETEATEITHKTTPLSTETAVEPKSTTDRDFITSTTTPSETGFTMITLNIPRQSTTSQKPPNDETVTTGSSTNVAKTETATTPAEITSVAVPEESDETESTVPHETTEQPTKTAETSQQPTEVVVLAEQPTESVATREEPADTVASSEKTTEPMVPTEQPTETMTQTEQPTGTVVPTEQPRETVTQTEQPTGTVVPTEKQTETVAQTEQPAGTVIPTDQPSETVAQTEQPTATVVPTEQPTQTVARTEQPIGTVAPTEQATETVAQTEQPTGTVAPTEQATETVAQTEQPTGTVAPTEQATETVVSSEQPSETMVPTEEATGTVELTEQPTQEVTLTEQPAETKTAITATDITDHTIFDAATEGATEQATSTETYSGGSAVPDDEELVRYESRVRRSTPLPLAYMSIPTPSENSTLESSNKSRRSIEDAVLVFPDISLQLQNGMSDSLLSRGYELYTQLPKRPFLVDGVSEELVPVMSYTAIFRFAYIRRLHARALEFPLDDERYKLLLLLPVERRGLRQLIYDLTSCPLREIYQALRPTSVQAIIPSFMVEGSVILTPTLQQLGIWDVFDPRRANLSGMSDDPELYVRNIEQSVTVVIRNYVKILDIQTRTMAARATTERFVITHPFLYFVLDTDTHVALMAGKIVDPLNSRIY